MRRAFQAERMPSAEDLGVGENPARMRNREKQG